MSFTDEDLKNLKDRDWTFYALPETEKYAIFNYLLARLEAAEKLVAWEWDNGNYQKLLMTWRRSCGK